MRHGSAVTGENFSFGRAVDAEGTRVRPREAMMPAQPLSFAASRARA
jgi:hypothetical protein